MTDVFVARSLRIWLIYRRGEIHLQQTHSARVLAWNSTRISCLGQAYRTASASCDHEIEYRIVKLYYTGYQAILYWVSSWLSQFLFSLCRQTGMNNCRACDGMQYASMLRIGEDQDFLEWFVDFYEQTSDFKISPWKGAHGNGTNLGEIDYFNCPPCKHQTQLTNYAKGWRICSVEQASENISHTITII